MVAAGAAQKVTHEDVIDSLVQWTMTRVSADELYKQLFVNGVFDASKVKDMGEELYDAYIDHDDELRTMVLQLGNLADTRRSVHLSGIREVLRKRAELSALESIAGWMTNEISAQELDKLFGKQSGKLKLRQVAILSEVLYDEHIETSSVLSALLDQLGVSDNWAVRHAAHLERMRGALELIALEYADHSNSYPDEQAYLRFRQSLFRFVVATRRRRAVQSEVRLATAV